MNHSDDKNIIKTESTKWIDWHHYCFSFLELSQLGLEKLLYDKFGKKDIGAKLIYPYKNTPLAIAYSVRHALELWLKETSVRTKGRYKKIHNQSELLSFLKGQCKVKDDESLERLSGSIYKYIDGNFYGGKLKKNDIADDENIHYKYPSDNILVVENHEKGIYALNEEDIRLLYEDVVEIGKLFLRLL